MSRPTASPAMHRKADLAVLALLAAFVALYCVDAARASTDVLNLILVLPVSIVVLVACAVQFALTAARARRAPLAAGPGAGAVPPPADAPEEMAVAEALPVIGLFAAYIATLPWLGFDAGSALFLAAFLWLQGERRWPWLAGYSIAFAFGLSLAFSRLLPYDMPLSLMGAS